LCHFPTFVAEVSIDEIACAGEPAGILVKVGVVGVFAKVGVGVRVIVGEGLLAGVGDCAIVGVGLCKGIGLVVGDC